MPLKGIPKIISPDLLYVLASMGHGDELILADAHFPTSSICRFGPKEIRADGIPIPKLLEAVLTLMPLDTYVSHPVCLMDKVPEDKAKGLQTPIWTEYQVIIDNKENTQINIEKLERFKFYERAKRAFAVVHTGETAQYGNIILKKGVAL
ncbi:fucose mutarotase-like isoform X1 [Mercenaria mercenaria]|uniref:fucose mutarotase-like isoform X1 n=1 Tax=Mercenaria mercenaria TaxID=6596 RepID=UPI001E1D59F2|nr:fucose mutarotase-like isoform X1 [Mercenaria mercenaria]XP_045191078.1 fucose mutarotase-like isoform X1 [Mercenaria mercenaria]XP_045191079.1 fucose mutarotase-like isoform X1 [Mercenaria mercenaria]